MGDTQERPIKKTIDIEEVAKRNPAIDPVKVRAALEAVQTLRTQGVERSQFELAMPFTRTRSAQGGKRR